MQIDNSAYSKEKQHALSHLWFILLISVVSFIFIYILEDRQSFSLFLLKVLLSVLSFYAILHYSFIVRFPTLFIMTRKFMLIVVDLAVLTLGIITLGSSGLFLLPLYILIVMESGVSLGFIYFYFSIIFSSFSWIILVYYSSYWQEHSDTVAIFAITTFLIPLVYLKQMMNMHQKHEKLHETLANSNYDANYDALTGLPNRKQYDTFMKDLLKERVFFALLFIDLNKFKIINDTYGHNVGDAVLIEVSKRLRRSIDEEDMLARLGGDEFVIITKRKKVFLAKFLEKLEQITISSYQMDHIDVLIELSIGISLFPNDSKSEIFLRKYADEAMYVAKKTPNKYHIFYEEIKSSEESF